MDGYDLVRSIQRWLDRFELVKPQAGSGDSGNGILYSCIYLIFLHELDRTLIDKLWFEEIIQRCSLEPGLLMRTPNNDYGQQSWDDYLGVAVVCILLNERQIAKEILSYGKAHRGFYRTKPDSKWNAFLWRFPQVWLLMLPAAYPWTRFPLFPFIWTLGRMMNLGGASPNDIQLIWVYHAGCKALGFKFKKYDTATRLLPDAFSAYYGLGHPFKDAAISIQ